MSYNDIGSSASRDDLQAALDHILESEAAKNKREQLSEKSFREWIYSMLRIACAKMGYALQTIEEFWTDVKGSIRSGWRDGVEQAKKEAAIRRRMREEKYK